MAARILSMVTTVRWAQSLARHYLALDIMSAPQNMAQYDYRVPTNAHGVGGGGIAPEPFRKPTRRLLQ